MRAYTGTAYGNVRAVERWDKPGVIDLQVHSPSGSWITVAEDIHPSIAEQALGLTGPSEIGLIARFEKLAEQDAEIDRAAARANPFLGADLNHAAGRDTLDEAGFAEASRRRGN